MSTLTEQEHLAEALGGRFCECSPEKTGHMRMPIGPAGSCPNCSATGPLYHQALDHAKIGGRVSGLYGIKDLSSPGVPNGGNPLLNPDGSVNWEALLDSDEDESVPWIVEPFLIEGMTHSLWGTPGHGKSLVTLETVVNHVVGKYHVLYVDNENHIVQVVKKRLRSFGATSAAMKKLHFYSFSQIPPLDTPEGGQELLRLAKLHDAKLVVIDTFSRFISGPEDKADTFTAFYNLTLMVLKRENIASLRLDHPGKDTTRGTRGSSAKYGDIDFEFSVEDPDKGATAYRKLTCTKSRTGEPALGSVTMLKKHPVNSENSRFWHEWFPENGTVPLVMDKISDDVKILDSLDLPVNAGRRIVLKALSEAKISMGGARVEAAIKARKTAQVCTEVCTDEDSSNVHSGVHLRVA